MKKITIQIYLLITAITLVHGACIIAAQEPQPYTLSLSKKEAELIGRHAIVALNSYLAMSKTDTQAMNLPDFRDLLEHIKIIAIPDKAIATAVRSLTDYIESNNPQLAIQMLGILLKDLNETYKTDLPNLDEIIKDLYSLPTKQEPQPYTLPLSKEEAQLIGDHATLALKTYLGMLKTNTQAMNLPDFRDLLEHIKIISIPDKTVATTVLFFTDYIKSNNPQLAMQMFGILLKELNETYKVNLPNLDELGEDIFSLPTRPTGIRAWLNRIAENIQYYMNRMYQAGRNFIVEQQKAF